MAYLVKLISKNRSNEKLIPQGVCIHDTATPSATALNEYTYFNNGAGGRSASAHAFIDWTDGCTIIQTVPYNEVSWGCGYTGNHKFINIECCVPKTHNVEQFNIVWNNTVQLVADLFIEHVKQYTITKDNLMSHAEVSNKWHETDHRDPIAFFKEYSKTVDDFRNEVQKVINTKRGIKPLVVPTPVPVPIPQPKVESMKYSIIGTTHVIEVSPMKLSAIETQCAGNKSPYANYVNCIYQMPQKIGGIYPQGILVSNGKVIANNMTHNLPCGTLIVYTDGTVDVKVISDITKESKPVWFAVSGCSILPNIRSVQEGFVDDFDDILSSCPRPMIGYNPTLKKVFIAVRNATDINRAKQTLINLGCTAGITMDAGGSTNLSVNGKRIFATSRPLFGVIMFD